MSTTSPSSIDPDAVERSDSPRSRQADWVRQERIAQREKLRTSRFDAVTSFFMALILFLATFVTMLFIVWLLSREPAPLVLKPQIEENNGRADNAEGFERDFEPPGEEEVEDLLEPTLEDTIEAVTDAVSSVASSLITNESASVVNAVGSGRGDSRPPGPAGEGIDVVPRGERWQLNFSAKDIKSYARQLDFFKIELGAVGGSIQGVDYAFDLSSNPKTRRQVDSAAEQRLYFMWTKPSPLQKFDRQLMQAAGVELGTGRYEVRFIPPELEEVLATLEINHAASQGHNSVGEISKTIFECKADGGDYRFEVVGQRYRVPRR